MGTNHSSPKQLSPNRESTRTSEFLHRNDAFVSMMVGGEEDEEEGAFHTQEFHNNVRENIIFLLFFLTLICFSSMVIDFLSPSRNSGSCGTPVRKYPSGSLLRKSPRRNAINEDEDESVVKRICSWLCTLTLSTSVGATLLLPISILSNEVLLIYPTNTYLEWLNGMLIQGLWNLVFLFSNIGLFLLLPFAHLFIEAEGFSGKKRGLMSKLQETIVVLALLTSIVWGISVIANSFFVTRGTSVLFHWNQLPFIYSFISFGGVLVFTLFTPLGLSRLFTVLSNNFVFVPEFMRNLDNEHMCAVLEYENLKNQLSQMTSPSGTRGPGDGIFLRRGLNGQAKTTEEELELNIENKKQDIAQLESLRTTPPWKRNLLYPGLFICVLAVTGLTVFIVVINAFKIVTGFRDISLELVAKETLPLGRSSLSFLGPSGAIFEIILVMYLITTCLIGLYSLPVFKSLTPARGSTPTSHLIYNCAITLVLSSALPVFMRILGLTNFDLLGTYAGKIDWIENTLIVVFVNLLFSALTCVCLISNVTRKISREIIRSFRTLVLHRD